MSRPSIINLDLPFVGQSRSSAACGTCCIKMALDYYQIKNREGADYSIPQLTKHLQVTRQWGMQEEMAQVFFEQQAMKMRLIKLTEVARQLSAGQPILALFQDEMHEGHFAMIKGLDEHKSELIFHDPWPDFGPNFHRRFETFKKQLVPFGPTNLWAISGPSL